MPHRILINVSWLLAGLVALFATGCGSSYNLGGITVSIVNFVPAGAALLESSGTMTLRYTNENTIPIGLSGGVHKIYFNGSYVGKAVSKQPLGLAPLSTATQDVTVNFENLALVKQLVAMRDQQNASYRVESILYLTSGEENLNIKTSNTGSVDLRALAPLMGGG
jgi:LEA14-like dessication related protein